MAIRDILVLNTTASRAETQQGSDTVAIRGDSGEALSIQNSSGTNILSVNTVSSSVDVAGKITATNNITASSTSTGSFGRLEATTLVGSAFNLTNTEIEGTISSSGQIAAEISGSFRRGFEFTGTIGHARPDLHDGQNKMTASFGRIVATSLSGSAANLTNTVLDNTLSSSAQIAADISGSFTSGFEFDNSISGSATSTGSFGRIDATTLTGNVSQMTNLVKTGLVSGSAQIAADITGSFQKGFEFDGHISGSASTTASFANVFATKAIGDISAMYNLYPVNTVSSSAQLASDISRSFAHSGFEFTGTISGSATSTGSFDNVFATTIHGDISNMTNIIPTNTVSSSAQIASDISGSFNKGFEFSGHISGSGASTGSFGRIEATSISGDGSNLTGTALTGTVSGSGQLAADISGSFNKGFNVKNNITNVEPTFAYASGTSNLSNARWRGASGVKDAGLAFGGQTPTRVGDTETFDGTTWTEVNNLNTNGPTVGGGTTNATVAFGGWYRGKCTETWDGTSWTEVNDLITSRANTMAPIKMSHSQNAALAAGGAPTTPSVATEEWNGTNWATANDLIKGMVCADGFGTPYGGVAIGTGWPSTAMATCAELWNGLNWSTGPLLPGPGLQRVTNAGTAGAENDGIVAGQCQYQGAIRAETACYNGITFNLGNDLPTACAFHRGAGTTVANSWFVGGQTPSSPYYPSSGFTVSSGVASGSFTHIDALRVSASVDEMTNIPEPEGTISSSAQLAADISGSFNKGFEFSGEIRSLGVWSAGGDFPGHTNSLQHSALYGTQNAALLGGGMGYYQASKCDTYSYNGTSWSDTGADMIEARGGYSGIGTQDAALAAGGNPYKSHIFQYLRTDTEEWNGSAWSKTTDLPHQLTFLNNQNAGTQNAGLIAGGFTGTGGANVGSGSEAFQRSNLNWDGLSYTIGASMTNERGSGGVAGSMNAALAQGGNNSMGSSTCTEEWNGSAWSDAAASNFPTQFTPTVGTSNNAMHTTDASSPVRTGCSDFYNGMSWSTGPLLGLANYSCTKQCAGAAGSTSAGLFMTFGNVCVEHFDENHTTSSIGRVDATELSLESDADLTIDESLQIPLYGGNPEVTSSAGEVWYNTEEEKLYFTYDINSWTEVADLISPKSFTFGSAGSGINDALFYGGYAPYPTTTATTELWNGTSWSEVADLQDNMIKTGGTGCSTNAAVMVGNPAVNDAETNVWDGSTWTEVNDHITKRSCTSMSGTANAALLSPGVAHGGSGSPTTEEWNGTNWSTSTNASLSYGQYDAQMIGTQNDTIKGVGFPQNANAAHYDGTSWASINAYNDDRQSRAGFGTANAAIYAGGRGGSNTGCPHTEEYNGISWKSVSSLGQGRGYGGRAGLQSSGMLSGGNYGSPNVRHCGNTEQYTTTGIGCHCIGGV